MPPIGGPDTDKQPTIVCAGIAVVDVVVHPVRQPLPMGHVQVVEGIELAAGGCAMTTATALRALGEDVGLSAALGDDPLGRYLGELASQRGIDRGGFDWIADRPTSASVVLVDEAGERTFMHVPGTSDDLSPDHVRASLHADLGWLHLAGLLVTDKLDGQPAAQIFRDAREMGVRTSADVVWDDRDRWHLMHPNLPYLDLFTPSQEEAVAISGRDTVPEAARWLHDQGVGVVAITQGGEGARVSDGEVAWQVPVDDVSPVDGTGAGDCFTAAMISGLFAGGELPHVASLAAVLGGVAVATVGAPSVFPDRDILDARARRLLERLVAI